MKVFVSHNKRDKKKARALATFLQEQGAEVWFDEWNIAPGHSIIAGLETGLASSDVLILIWSEYAASSVWVDTELRAYLRRRVENGSLRIVPLILDETPLPTLIAEYRGFVVNNLDDLRKAAVAITEASPAFDLETVKCSLMLDIIRLDGSIVKYTKVHTTRCIYGTVSEFIEEFAADGRIREFKTSPGHIGHMWQEAGMLHIQDVFPKPLNFGERITRRFSCNWYDTFIDEDNYWCQRQYYPSKNIEILVRFPLGRPPKRWIAEEIGGARTRSLNDHVKLISLHGKPTLQYKISNPVLFMDYSIRWWW